MCYLLSLFLPALLFISSGIAIALPEGYIIPQETLSPTHRYGFMAPMLKSFLSNNVSTMDNLHNSLIDMKTGQIIADINAAYGFDRSVNY